MIESIKDLEKILNIQFENENLLTMALTHRSYLNEAEEESIDSNERLEFLGDAVLQFLTSEFIYKEYKDFHEGQLTNLRSKLVNKESLAKESARLSLGNFLQLSKGEKETAANSDYILANTFEAILGALFLDKGIDVCREYLTKELFFKAKEIVDSGALKDPKSLLQEKTQEQYAITPTYKVIEENGPDHNKSFKVGVYLDKVKIAEGEGSSKRKAEQEVAKVALELDLDKLITKKDAL